VAAVREAARILLDSRASLRRPVVIALFGAEEWGLRGSAHFVAHPPEGFPRIVACLSLDTVGQRGVEEVDVVGRSVYPALGSLAARCLAGAGLGTGRDIDKFAFAWGSDHYSFHRAGIPAVDLFSAEYRTMHTPADTPDTVDPAKVARVARAAAAFALAVSRDGPPR
jgi:Zn-dependent M28 family amino/carboxypeptidase